MRWGWAEGMPAAESTLGVCLLLGENGQSLNLKPAERENRADSRPPLRPRWQRSWVGADKGRCCCYVGGEYKETNIN